MRLLRINHLGIASPGLDEAVARMARLFDLAPDHLEAVPDQRVNTAFFPVGESTLEFLESTDPEGPIGKFLQKRGPGIHHICFEVDDVDAMVTHLVAQGVRMIDAQPRPGAHGCRVAFIHPAETGGVLMELSQTWYPGSAGTPRGGARGGTSRTEGE